MSQPLKQDRGPLWELARNRMGRRRFLGLMAAGGVAAVLAACGVGEPSELAPTSLPAVGGSSGASPHSILKDPSNFLVHDEKSWEARLENMQGLLTSNHLFFVRNNSVSPEVNPRDWRLTVEGDGVANPMQLTYTELRSLPSRVLTCYLECGGNHRAMFDLVQGRAASGTQWKTGGVSNGEWVGICLRDVLDLAGVRDSAV